MAGTRRDNKQLQEEIEPVSQWFKSVGNKFTGQDITEAFDNDDWLKGWE